jgi:signal peptide peptidase SppA
VLKTPGAILVLMLARYAKKSWLYIKSFFTGLLWPFTWMENKTASIGLVVAIFLIASIGAGVGILTVGAIGDWGSSGGSSNAVSDVSSSGTSTASEDPNCNAVGIEIRGCIMTYKPDNADSVTSSVDSPCTTITSSEAVTWALESAASDPKIKAVVLEIDSSGGSPAAAQEIAAATKALGKPSIAWVRESADSAAYWIASAADTIIASESSDVGSIGVTMSYTDNAKKNATDGVTYNQLTTGKYKDTGTPDRALTADERSLIQRDLNITLQNFIKAVATNRHLSVEKVTALADGSSMLGAMALHNGLIDQLGTKQEVWKKLGADINDKPNVCWR